MGFRRSVFYCTALLAITAVGTSPVSAESRYTTNDLLTLNVEQLADVRITTLSKREEKYMSTAGAVYVITNDDIRRSGARSIPEALRLAPGLQVSQTNMNQWQIGIRGQSDFFTDLLLVMIDGRPVYTTTFSGTWWQAQNYPLEDIEQIEIVRGPGGAIWGSNAVNGVINIITKSAADSQKGLRISGGGGTKDRHFGNISYADSAGKVDYRFYAMNELRGTGTANRDFWTLNPAAATVDKLISYGDPMPDSRLLNQQGFRMDWENDTTRYSLHGDNYNVKTGVAGYWLPNYVTPANVAGLWNGHLDHIDQNRFKGKNLVLEVEKEYSPHITLKAHMLYDQYRIDTKVVHENKQTFDGDLQVDFNDVLNQKISIGANLRRMHGRFDNTPHFQMPSRKTGITSFFINDELSLLDELRLIGGVKVERNSYTDWIYQPSARAIYSNDTFALWAAASRSVRTPNDMENGLRWDLRRSSWMILRLIGDGRAQPEKVTTYEVGARLRPTDNSLFEFTAFKIFYKGVLDTWADVSPAAIAGNVIPTYLTNVLNGRGDGFEANFNVQPCYWMTLKGSYTYLHQAYIDYPIQDAQTIWTVNSNKGQDPRSRFHVGLSLNPLESIELDTNLYFQGPFREGDLHVYHRLDVRLGWKPAKNLEFAVVGQDLLRASYLSNIESIMGYESRIPQRYYMSVNYTYD